MPALPRLLRLLLALALLTLLGACDDEPQSAEDVLEDISVDSTRDTTPFEISERQCGLTECSEDQTCCDFECVDVFISTEHCGSCGNTCRSNESCNNGVCGCGDNSCGPQQTCCGAGTDLTCVQTNTNINNCGACGNVCLQGEQCTNGICLCNGPNNSPQQCREGQLCCEGRGCTDVLNDPFNCGACGNQCGAGEFCAEGACTCGSVSGTSGANACGDGEACCGSSPQCVPRDDALCECGDGSCSIGQACCTVTDNNGDDRDACFSTDRDIEHCGSCGNICGARQLCSGGACVCQPGFADCNRDPSDGCEIRLDSDSVHCGACGKSCAPGEVCDGTGKCTQVCQEGLTDCSNVCTDLQADRNNCGACGIVCDPSELCSGGFCAVSCQAGLTDCGGNCINLATDRASCGFCGNVCAPGYVCSGGFCAVSCESGLRDCGGNCVDLRLDRRHCGACGNICEKGFVCDRGACKASCPDGIENCGGNCVNLSSNKSNCGDCGVQCGPNALCVEGECRVTCPQGFATCGERCFDLTKDRNNCGGCGVVCTENQVCNNGSCDVICPVGFESCNNTCVKTSTNNSHCGACNQACASGQACDQGVCRVQCSSGRIECPNTGCIDTSSDVDHCGGCGQACSANQICLSGSCACKPGFADCDGDSATGCEAQLESDPQACGSCDNICPVGQSCFTGACVDNVIDIGAGRHHTCALRATGIVECWGSTESSQVMGFGDVVDPQAISLSVTPTALAIGGDHNCILADDDTIWCWGDNTHGQLGTNDPSLEDPVPAQVNVSGTPVQLVAGARNTCAVFQSGDVQCWGDNDDDQLGAQGPADRSRIPVTITGLPGIAVQVAVGVRHACAMQSDGKVFCWGFNGEGALGDGTRFSSATPVEVSGLAAAVDIAAGLDQTCVLVTSGQVLCWGLGQLTPAAVSGLSGTRELRSQYEHMCALMGTGELQCWGRNFAGQLGDDTFSDATTPRRVPTVSNAFDFTVGWGHTCALTGFTDVRCWGANNHAQSGTDISFIDSDAAYAAVDINNITTVAMTDRRTCVLAASGSNLECYGLDDRAAPAVLGTFKATPEPGFDGLIAVSAGSNHMCGVRSSGTVVCLGDNSDGQLGNGTRVSSFDAPIITTINTATDIAVGTRHTCAILTDGSVTCWGANERGQLGDGTTTDRTAPVAVSGLSASATQLALGDDFTCALLNDQTVECWGHHDAGQLGDSALTDTFSASPVAVVGATGVASITAGGKTALLLTDAGAVSCWGQNNSGQCAQGNYTNPIPEPSPVAALNSLGTIESFSMSNGYGCASTSGSVYCWGSNTDAMIYSGYLPSQYTQFTSIGTVQTGPRWVCGIDSATGAVQCRGVRLDGNLGDLNHIVRSPSTLSRIP